MLYTPATGSFQAIQPANETPFTKRVHYFKLRLLSEELWEASTEEKKDLGRYIGETAYVAETNSHPTNLVSTFLTHLWEGALSVAKQRFPSYGNISVVLTYPGCFERNLDANRDFRQAVANTKFQSADGSVQYEAVLMTEHEAVLRCALLESRENVWDCVWVGLASLSCIFLGSQSNIPRTSARVPSS